MTLGAEEADAGLLGGAGALRQAGGDEERRRHEDDEPAHEPLALRVEREPAQDRAGTEARGTP